MMVDGICFFLLISRRHTWYYVLHADDDRTRHDDQSQNYNFQQEHFGV